MDAARGSPRQGGRRDPRALDHAFDPRAIAVVGASADRTKWANILFRRLIEGPYRGAVYAVNSARDVIEGRPCYRSIAAVPEEIDYAQLLVPRDHVLTVVRECVARRVKVVHVLSSGFGEVGDDGRRIENDLRDAVKDSGTVLIGPNSLGLYSARAGLDFSKGCLFEPGVATFVSQSGALCTDVIAIGQARGLRFSKMLSIGNCCDLDWPDFVRYCRDDPETEIAAFYVESVRDGRALYEELKALAAVKPVLLLKGGRTARGNRSVQSHTGRLSGDFAIWQAMMRQAGVTELLDLEDLLIALEAAQACRVRPERGPGDGLFVIGSGGGISVLATDAAERAGLVLADLAETTLADLRAAIPDAAELGGAGNPAEMPVDRMFADETTAAGLIELAARDPGVGAVLIHVNLIALANQFGEDDGGPWTRICGALSDTASRIAQPLAVVLRNGESGKDTARLLRTGMAHLAGAPGIAVFAGIEQALRFLGHVVRLRRRVS